MSTTPSDKREAPASAVNPILEKACWLSMKSVFPLAPESVMTIVTPFGEQRLLPVHLTCFNKKFQRI